MSAIRKFILALLFTGVFLGAVRTAGFSDEAKALPFPSEETFHFAIKKFLKMGDVNLTFKGMAQVDGAPAYWVEFKGTGVNFLDEDDIYLDPATFFPLKVSRNLNVFGKKEQIVEKYSLTEGTVVIVKTAGGKTTTQTIRKDGPIENIYGFIYRYRLNGQFTPDESIQIRLPTKDILIKYRGLIDYAFKGKTVKAHYFESEPEQFRIWFSEPGFLPGTPGSVVLRLDGAVGLGSTSMILD